MVIERIIHYLGGNEVTLFRERWEFIRHKTEPARDRILKAVNLPDEDLCRVINEEYLSKKTKGTNFLFHQLAMEGQVDFVEKLEYLGDAFGVNRPLYSSTERYEKYKKETYAKDLDENYIKEGLPWCYYREFLYWHDLEPVLRDGVRLCFDNPKTRDVNFEFEPRNPSTAPHKVEAAWILLHLGLYERAEKYLDTLRGYQRILRGRTRPDLSFAKRFAGIIDVLDLLIAAKRASNPEEARRHAARAILAHLGAAIDNMNHGAYAGAFMCYNLDLPICMAVDFDFDPQWARRCCQALFLSTRMKYYHSVFFKARDWGAWARMPEEMGWLPLTRIKTIYEEVRQKYPYRCH